MELHIAIMLIGLLLMPLLFIYVSRRIRQRERDQALTRRLSRGPAGARPQEWEAGQRGVVVWLARAVADLPWLGGPLSEALLSANPATLIAMPALFVLGALVFSHWGHLGMALALGILLAAVPALYQHWRHTRQLKLFSEQLPYLIDLLKSALESGHTLLRALQMAAQNLPEPVAGEVQLMVDQVQLGMTVSDAFERMYSRAPVEELGFLVAAVRIQSDVGSSLAEILQHVSESVRNRQRAEHQLRALTAQSRASAIIVTLLPFIVLAAFSLINPAYAHPLFYSRIGIRLLQLAIALDAAAFLVMRRLAQLDY